MQGKETYADWKKPDPKEYTLWAFTCEIQEGMELIYHERKRASGCLGLRVGMTSKGHEERFWDAGCIPYLDGSSIYVIAYIYQN